MAIWPIVTQPSLQAWGRSSWSSWCGAAWKGSPAGDILMVSTVTSKFCGPGPEELLTSCGAIYVVPASYTICTLLASRFLIDYTTATATDWRMGADTEPTRAARVARFDAERVSRRKRR